MRSLILAAGISVLAASAAFAGTANNPDFVRTQQGSAHTGGQITCASTTTNVDNGSTDARAFTVCGQANSAYVCMSATGATPIPCTAALGRLRVTAGQCVTIDSSVRGIAFSCIRDGGADGVINYVIEK